MLYTLFAAAALSIADFTEHDYAAHRVYWNKHAALSEDEFAAREALFVANKAKVVAHNKRYHEGSVSYWLALNAFADQTEEEFGKLRSTKYNPVPMPIASLRVGDNPSEIDWRTKGAVTDVKNQGGCGSCWAFSATETVESHYQIAGGELVKLAPQAFVDCVQNPQGCGGTGGCEGATMELAFNLTVAKGLPLEADLPYHGRDEACPSYTPAVKATGYVKNPVNDAAAFETALATVGPQSVTVAANSWQLYGGGLFHGCSKGLFGHGDNTLDHGVQAVGYTKDYWIVRNSWGAGWGEQGYIRLSRAADDQTFTDKHPEDGVACKPFPKTQTVGGECGVLFDTPYPTGVHKA